MKKIKNYNDYLLDSLLESAASDGTMPFLFSEEFLRIVQKIDHPIASKILGAEYEVKPVTFIDITEENDKVSFSTSVKIIDHLSKYYEKGKEDIKLNDFFKYNRGTNDLWNKYRSTMKVGKLVKKLFGDQFSDSGKPGNDIESFVNEYKVAFDKDGSMNLFNLVQGDDIIKWYNKENYNLGSSGSELHNSCMADEDCGDFIKFYAKNEKVKLLILYSDDEKTEISGRALVWSLDEPEGRTFMDRIYTIYDHQEQFFINYAKKHGWLYKEIQTFGRERIVDPKNQTKEYMTLEVHDIKLNKYYPYVDTLQYIDQDEKILSTDEVSNVKLNSTDGEPGDCKWSDKYNRWINMYDFGGDNYISCNIGTSDWDEVDRMRKPEDAIKINYYKDYIPKELYDELIIKTKIGIETELLKSDAFYCKHYKGWTTEDYALKNMIFSEYEGDFFKKEDVVKSKYVEDYLFKDNATKVYTDVTKTETDYIPNDEVSYRAYKDKKGDLIMTK